MHIYLSIPLCIVNLLYVDAIGKQYPRDVKYFNFGLMKFQFTQKKHKTYRRCKEQCNKRKKKDEREISINLSP